MIQITISDDFARQLAGASAPVVLFDGQGNQLGQFTPDAALSNVPFQISPEYLTELEHRFENPGSYSTLDEIKARRGW